MGSSKTRRLSAWLALGAMLTSFALPAHAKLMRVAADGPKGDMCVAGKLVPGAPATPNASHACDACCATPAAAPPAERPAPAVAKPSASRLPAIDLLPMPSGGVRAALARGPPILL